MSEAEFYIIYVKFTSLICISFVTSLFRSIIHYPPTPTLTLCFKILRWILIALWTVDQHV